MASSSSSNNPQISFLGRNVSVRQVLLADGLGAFLSALLLGGVLARWVPVFGMPAPVVYSLSAVAVIMALNSLTAYRRAGLQWRMRLRWVAGVNVLYIVATLVLTGYHYTALSLWGLLYFGGELLIIALLVLLEYRLLRKADRPVSNGQAV